MTVGMAVPVITPVAQAGAGAVFGTIAKLRGDRSLHPTGVAFAATFVVEQPRLKGARLFARRTERPAYVRFSRGFGLPEPLPEILSLAVKVPGAYGPGRDQDLLMTATGDRPVLRHVFFWGRSHVAKRFSSVLPFRVGERTMLLGAVPRVAPALDGGRDLEELELLAAQGRLSLDLQVATPTGPWRTVARLDVGERLSAEEEDALGFNSDTTGGGIAPLGFINRLRGAAYDASIAGRGAK
jgi:hypothetical protein